MESKKTIRSPFFYVGDKYKLMPQLKQLMPKNIEQYIEPFVGGGSSFLNSKGNSYMLNDVDSYVVELHKVIGGYTGKAEELFEELFEIIDFYGLSCSYRGICVPEELKSDEEAMAQVKEITETGFNRLDLNKDGQIDYEELSAYIHAMDFGTEDGKSNGLNGKISAYDFMVNSLSLAKSEKSKLDEKLAYAYKALFGKNVA